MALLFIGVDGGGTGCRVAICGSDGRLIGQGTGGPANALSDPEGTIANIDIALRAALAAADLSPSALLGARAHAGLAGVVDTSFAEIVADRLATVCPATWTVSEDRDTHALGALGGKDGALVAIGTGSFVARVEGGTVRGLGGWGFVLGDEASGADLGRAALRHTLHAVDGLVAASALTDAMLALHDGANGIVRVAARATPAEFAALAPHVLAAAGQGDATAHAILSDAAAYIDRALAALGVGRGDRLCLSGGLGPHFEPWLATAKHARIVPPAGTALDGALARAGAPRPEPHP